MNSPISASQDKSQASKAWLLGTGLIVLIVAVIKLIVHLYADRHYGYYTDELYFLACGRHLAWGYVDQPPLIAVIARVTTLLFGDSLAAIRFFPALAGAAKIVLTGLIARELGGGRFAQGLAALAVLLAPGFLGIDNLLSMNAFEPLFWLGCAYLVLRIIRTGNQRLWLSAGLLAGLGLLNKHSMLIFGFALIAGLMFTPERRILRMRWFWAGALIALLIFLPNLLWNFQNHFPFLELQANIRRDGRNVDLGPIAFFGQEVRAMLPLALPVWLAGLWFYLFSEKGRPFRALGCACLMAFAIFYVANPRVYYLWPAFPLLLAAGGVVCESWLSRPSLLWLKLAYPASMIAVGGVLAPTVLPVFPPQIYIQYAAALHLQTPAIEKWQLGPLPQIFAAQFGWPEMVATVAQVYNSLPPESRDKTAIFAQNFGQAGAIDLFGPKYGLPPALSGHQNYFLWGPGDYSGESMIVLQGRKETLENLYDKVELRARIYHPYSMPREWGDVYYCRGLKGSLSQMWPGVKNWH